MACKGDLNKHEESPFLVNITPAPEFFTYGSLNIITVALFIAIVALLILLRSHSLATTMAEPLPPLAVITSTDKKGIIVTVAAVTLSFVLVCFCARVWIRLRVSRPWSHDDSVLALATAIAIAQSTVVFVSVDQGFGLTNDELDDQSVRRIGKTQYAANVLYLIGLCLSKCSAVGLFMRISSVRRHTQASIATILASIIWAITSILLISISCSAAAPFVNLAAQCSGLFARWSVICALDIVTDVVIFGIAVSLVAGLQMPLQIKSGLLLAFGLRLPVTAAAAVRLNYVHGEIYSGNPTLNGVLAATWTQIHLNYSVISTTLSCVGSFVRPFTKPYLAPVTTSHAPGSGMRSANMGYNLSNLTKSSYGKRKLASRESQTSAQQITSNHSMSGNYPSQPKLRHDPVSHEAWVESSQRSLDSHDSQRMIITKKEEWSVLADENTPRPAQVENHAM